MSHTKEPWKVVYEEGKSPPRVDGIYAGEERIVETDSGYYPPNSVNAERIVTCVNGCAGLNPAAYREVVEALTWFVNEAERDVRHGNDRGSVYTDVLASAKQALAQVKEAT